MSKAAHFLGMLAVALDRGEGAGISYGDIRRHVESRDLFDFLDDEIPSFRSRYLMGSRGAPLLEELERVLLDPAGASMELSCVEWDFETGAGLPLLVFLATAVLERGRVSQSLELEAVRSKRLVLFRDGDDVVFSLPAESDASSCVYVGRGDRQAKFRLEPLRVLRNDRCGGRLLGEMTQLVHDNKEQISRVVGGLAS